MSSWHSYPSSYALGHRAIKDLFTVPLLVEEKVDGSQFSWGLVEANRDSNGQLVDALYNEALYGDFALKVRSKGAIMHIDAPEALFKEACETVKDLAARGLLHPGWTYRGECLKKPKHNSLVYDRVPRGHVIIFDISTGDQEFLDYDAKVAEAARLGLEVVPLLFTGRITDPSEVRRFLETVSILGGQKIEGVVLKPVGYVLYGLDKKALMGKFVSEAFKEVHRKVWGESNPSNKDIISKVCDDYTTAARWQKAVLHLDEQGKLEHSVRDIGIVIREVPEDVLQECEAEIKDRLFAYAWPHIRRGLTRGLPEWYKDRLMRDAFEAEEPKTLTTVEELSGQTVGISPEGSDRVG